MLIGTEPLTKQWWPDSFAMLYALPYHNAVAHLPLVLHICVSEMGQYCFRQWLGVKPLPEPMLAYYYSVNSNKNTKLFLHENAFENIVCDWNGDHFVQGGIIQCLCWPHNVKPLLPQQISERLRLYISQFIVAHNVSIRQCIDPRARKHRFHRRYRKSPVDGSYLKRLVTPAWKYGMNK